MVPERLTAVVQFGGKILVSKYGILSISTLTQLYIYIYMRLVQVKKSLRQMILFSQTGRKPWLPISYIMRNIERKRNVERERESPMSNFIGFRDKFRI